MRITQWGEYGAHIAAYVARAHKAGRPLVAAAEIAESQKIALYYTQQILLRLKDGGVLESIRGPHGGYRLSRPSEQISLLDVLRASEGDTVNVICDSKPIDSERCAPNAQCGLRSVWYGLKAEVDAYLSKVTLDSLALEELRSPDQPISIGANAR